MTEIVGAIEEVLIKKSDAYPDDWCIVHDGVTLITVAEPGVNVWTGEDRTMLVGTKRDLWNEVQRLELEIPQRFMHYLE